MSEIDKTRWRNLTRVAAGYTTLLDADKYGQGIHNPDIVAGATSQTALVLRELPKARGVAPVVAGELAAAGLRLTHLAKLGGEPRERMTTEALCTLKSLRQGVIATEYADHLEGALLRYGDAGVIRDASERDGARGILSGSWGAAVTSNTPHTTTDEPVVRPSGPSQRRGLGGADCWP